MKETEQTLLNQIKNDIAKDHEYSDFRQIFPDLQDFEHYSLIITEIAERYATAKAKAIVLEKDEIIARMGNEIERLDNLLFENRDKEFTRSQVQASCEATLKKAADRFALLNTRKEITDQSNIVIL